MGRGMETVLHYPYPVALRFQDAVLFHTTQSTGLLSFLLESRGYCQHCSLKAKLLRIISLRLINPIASF